MDSNSKQYVALDFNKFIDFDDEILTESELTDDSGDLLEYWNERDESGLKKRSSSHEFSFDEDNCETKLTTQSPQGEYLGLEPEQEISPETTTEFRFVPKQGKHRNDRNVTEWLEHLGDQQWSEDGSLQEELEPARIDNLETVSAGEETAAVPVNENLDVEESTEFVNIDSDSVNLNTGSANVYTEPASTETVNADAKTVATESVNSENVNGDAENANSNTVISENTNVIEETVNLTYAKADTDSVNTRNVDVNSDADSLNTGIVDVNSDPDSANVDSETTNSYIESVNNNKVLDNQDLNEEVLEDDVDDIEKMNRRNSTEMYDNQFERNQWRSRSLQGSMVSSREGYGCGVDYDRSYAQRDIRRSSTSSSASINIDNGNIHPVSGGHGYHGNDHRISHDKTGHRNTPKYDYDVSEKCHRRRSSEKNSARQPSDVRYENKSAFTKINQDSSTERHRSSRSRERKHRSHHEYDNLHHKPQRHSGRGSSSTSSDFADVDYVPPRASTPYVGRTDHDVTLYMSASPIGDVEQQLHTPRRNMNKTAGYRDEDYVQRNDDMYHHGNMSFDRVPNSQDSNNNQFSNRINRTFPPSLVLALDSYRHRRERSRDREVKTRKDIEHNTMKPTRCASPSLARGRRSPVVEVIRHSLATVQAEEVSKDLAYNKNRFYIPTFSEFKKMRKSGMLPEFDQGGSEPRTRTKQRSNSLRLTNEMKNLRLDLGRLIDTDDFQSSSLETSPRSSRQTVDSEESSPVHTPRIGSGKQEEEQRARDIRRTNALRQKLKQSSDHSALQKHETEKNKQINKISNESINKHGKDSSAVTNSSAQEKQSTAVSKTKKYVEHPGSVVKQDLTDKSSKPSKIQDSPGKAKILTENEDSGRKPRNSMENQDSSKKSVRILEKQNSIGKATETFETESQDSVRKLVASNENGNSVGKSTKFLERQDTDRKDTKTFDTGISDSVRNSTEDKQATVSESTKLTEKQNSSNRTTKSAENQESFGKVDKSVDNDDEVHVYQEKLRQMKENRQGKRAKLLESEFGDFDVEDKVDEKRDNTQKGKQNLMDYLESDDSLPGAPVKRRFAMKQKHSKDEIQTGEDEIDKGDPVQDASKQQSESETSDSDIETCRENISQVTETKKSAKRKSVGSIIAEYTKSTMLTKSDNALVRQQIQELQSDSQDKVELENKHKQRDHVHVASIVSVSSIDSGIGTTTVIDENKIIALPETKQTGKKDSGVVRTDSGVGSENGDITCEDCRLILQLDGKQSMAGYTVCRKCEKRRIERKEAITEIVQTEISYGDDLKLILQEFFKPIKSASLLSDEQLDYVFLNIEELEKSNDKLADILQDALDFAAEEGDEDYTTVNFGKLLLENMDLFSPFEEYCINQAAASVMLSTLESEKELLRVFLEVSQKENIQLRKLHLKSFLMAPVQRITKYPLLLSRLHKTTPEHNEDSAAIKEAQKKIEKILENINAKTQRVILPTGGKSKNVRRSFSNLSLSFNTSMSELKKLSLDTLGWNKGHVKFLKIGRLQCSQPTDQMWQKVKKSDLQFKTVHVLLVLHGEDVQNYKPPDEDEFDDTLQFPRNSLVKQAALVIFKDRTNEKFTLHRDPFMLDRCVVSSELGIEEIFEVIDMGSNDILVFKTDNSKETVKWIRYIRHQTKNLGGWRRRRNALANIMITSMVRT